MKSPAAPTVMVTSWVFVVKPELDARTVTMNVPVCVDPLVAMVNVELVELFAGGVTVVGLKPVPAAKPAGRFNASSNTPWLKPPVLFTVTAYVALWP